MLRKGVKPENVSVQEMRSLVFAQRDISCGECHMPYIGEENE